MKKNKIILKRITLYLIFLVTIVSLIYTIFEIIKIYQKPKNLLNIEESNIIKEEHSEVMFSKDVELSSLRKKHKNNDIIARLEIPGVINILLTQTDNNDLYLKYDINKQRSSMGTEFIDYRNSLFDKQINIYGHNAKYYNAPFKKLELFKEKEFFDNNEYILLQHSIGRRIYKIVAFKRITTDYEHMQIETSNHKEHINKLLANSIYTKNIEYDENTNILILQTCTTDKEKSYYLLIAFEI